jgi:hypothetical protein
MSFTKYPFSVKILEDVLKKNQEELEFWNDAAKHENIKISTQAKGNIGGCESRVKDLIEAIKILRPEANEVK